MITVLNASLMKIPLKHQKFSLRTGIKLAEQY